MTCSC